MNHQTNNYYNGSLYVTLGKMMAQEWDWWHEVLLTSHYPILLSTNKVFLACQILGNLDS